MRQINRLNHGGIMANYQCNAACRHCLYACSPDRDSGYITKESASEICTLLIEGGCRSVHIGGGEPFLNFDGLINLLEAARATSLKIEYVETNGSFAANESEAVRYLRELIDVGVDNLCISLDPFHAEYIPFELPLRLAKICRENNFGFFLWQERFLQGLSQVEPDIAHSRKSLEDQISPRYVIETAHRYGLSMGGRAINIEAEFSELKATHTLIETKPCRHLTSTEHFHVDMYGSFIPPGCTGIAIPLSEAVGGMPSGKYMAFEALVTGGVSGLVSFAKKQGFRPNDQYTSRCALCFYTRKWLSENIDCPELDKDHYTASLTYYN